MIEVKNVRDCGNANGKATFDTFAMAALSEAGQVLQMLQEEVSYDAVAWSHMCRKIGAVVSFVSLGLMRAGHSYERGDWFPMMYEEERVDVGDTIDATIERFKELYFGLCYDVSLFRNDMETETSHRSATMVLRGAVALGSMFMTGEAMEKRLCWKEGSDGSAQA